MFKVFAFGFDVWIKTILPLINCLINDLCSVQLTPVCTVSSDTLAEMHPTDLRDMPVSLAIWRVSHLFNKIIQTSQISSLLWNELNFFSVVAFQYMQSMIKLRQIIYAVVCYHVKKEY